MKTFLRIFAFIIILSICISTVFPFWLLILEHMFRGHNSILQLILDNLELPKKEKKEVKKEVEETIKDIVETES